jgi:hypothetical protein
MSDAPSAPKPPAPPRHVPPSGLRVTLVLLGLVLGISVVCLACFVGYMFYVDLHQR